MKNVFSAMMFLVILESPVVAQDTVNPARAQFLASPHFVSDAVFEQIYNLAVKYNGHDEKERENSEELRNVYCNGTVPRFVVRRTANFAPKVDSGVALDYANEVIFKQTEMAKFFMKQDFLYASGWGKDVSEYLSHHSYLKHDTINDPVHISSSDYHDFFYDYRRLSIDMGLLIKHFTFKIPKNIVPTMYGTPDDMFNINRFGYSSGAFLPSEAIDFKMYIWRYVLIHDTQVKEAANDDGAWTFEVNWTPNLFCKYAFSDASLKSL